MYELNITGLASEGNRLRGTLGMKNWARALDFKFDELKGRRSKKTCNSSWQEWAQGNPCV